jgi:hypothetical protein
MGNLECGMGKWECGSWNVEVGMRPPASPSCRLYEPEAVGAIGAYPPACKPMAPISLRAGLRLVAARSYASERSGPGGKWECANWNLN